LVHWTNDAVSGQVSHDHKYNAPLVLQRLQHLLRANNSNSNSTKKEQRKQDNKMPSEKAKAKANPSQPKVQTAAPQSQQQQQPAPNKKNAAPNQKQTNHNDTPSRDETRIDRIYFINLDRNPGRRAFMERWLSKQTIPFERVTGKVGDPTSDTCIKGKTGPKRCRGIAGVAKSDISIIDSYNTTGLTLVMEDDHFAKNVTRLQESILLVPDDWDIIRFNCGWGQEIPSDFTFLHVEPGNELQIKQVFETRHTTEQPPCNGTEKSTCRFEFCAGAHAMVWRGSRVQNLREVWSRKPYDDIDCRLTDQNNLRSYCINFRGRGEVIHKQIKGEITNIPKNNKA
jgi:hypothetical protein